MRFPVLSDTHGLLRPAVAAALKDAPLMVHAGDVGKDEVLDALEAIAPVHAIRGNVDRTGRVGSLPANLTLEIGGRRLHLVHDRNELDVDPVRSRLDIVVSGHSHRAVRENLDGVLYLNPGSVGPRRFRLPITMAWLTLGPPGTPPGVEFVEFDP